MSVVNVSNDHKRDRNAKLAARERRMNERLAQKHRKRERIAKSLRAREAAKGET